MLIVVGPCSTARSSAHAGRIHTFRSSKLWNIVLVSCSTQLSYCLLESLTIGEVVFFWRCSIWGRYIFNIRYLAILFSRVQLVKANCSSIHSLSSMEETYELNRQSSPVMSNQQTDSRDNFVSTLSWYFGNLCVVTQAHFSLCHLIRAKFMRWVLEAFRCPLQLYFISSDILILRMLP